MNRIFQDLQDIDRVNLEKILFILSNIYLVNWRYLILCGVSAADPSRAFRSTS
jgi:hypothetical protein